MPSMQALDHHMIATLNLQLLIRMQQMIKPCALLSDPGRAAVDTQNACLPRLEAHRQAAPEHKGASAGLGTSWR
ncbi:MAG: hypothetical protein HC858_06905 [Brachymonas sp.]|nr:hypothetical protein [Brachymonas sp.]